MNEKSKAIFKNQKQRFLFIDSIAQVVGGKVTSTEESIWNAEEHNQNITIRKLMN